MSSSSLTTAGAAHAVGRPLKLRWLLLTFVALLIALVWLRAGSIRQWQYERTATDDLLTQARQQPDNLALVRVTGKRLIDEGRASEAASLLVPIAQAHAQNAELNLLAGRAVWPGHDPQQAAALLNTALQDAPDDPDVCYWCSRFLYQRGHRKEAEDLLAHATQLDPNRADAWADWGEIALNALDYNTALQRLDHAEQAAPSGHVAWLRARVLKAMGRTDAAEAAVRTAVAREPLPQAYSLLGEILQSSPSPDKQREAVSCFQQALRQDPNNTATLKLLAVSYRGLGEPEKAVKVLRKTLRLQPALTEGYMLLSQSYSALGKPDLAARCMAIFRQLQPLQDKADAAQHRLSVEHGSTTAELRYARSLLELGRRDMAATIIQRSWFKNPGNEQVLAVARLADGPPLHEIPPLPPDPAGEAP